MSRLRIGLIGWGTVGCAVGQLILHGPLPIELAGVALRDPQRPRSGLPPGVPVMSADELVDGVQAVVEVAGGVEQPLAWARAALGRGIPFVTANKALLATHGEELAKLAHDNHAALLGSASVGGGVPMIELVEHLAFTGAIERVTGLLNATSTYLLSEMSRGLTYDQALAEAQRVGYAEADPTLDVTGRDAAQKLSILASVSGVESVLEVHVRDSGTFRVSGPGAGGRATAGAVYADLARLLSSGEPPILFGGSTR
jgi:homoserine dehydrogenase